MERLLKSDDKKLRETGLERMREELRKKDAMIDNLKKKISRLESEKGKLAFKIIEGQEEIIIRDNDGSQKRCIWAKGIKEGITEMTRDDFENRFGDKLRSVGFDPRDVLEGLSQEDAVWLNDPTKYLEKISEALKDKTKDVVVFDGYAYIVNK